jgi:signal transduction histidine kinase
VEAAAQHATTSSADALAFVLGEHGVDDATVAAARGRADAAGVLSAGEKDGADTVLLGEAIATSALERIWSAKELKLLMRDAALVAADRVDGLAARAFVAAVRSPATLALPAGRAIEAQLALLAAFTDVPEASLWVDESGIRCVGIVGSPEPSPENRAFASQALGACPPAPEGPLRFVPVALRGRTRAVLVFGGRPDLAERELAFASESAVAVAPLVELELVSARALAQERMAAEAGARLSVRLGFDLHDGPLQEFAALAADLRLLRAQIDEAPLDVVRGRIDDALGLLGSVERHVRDLARSVDSSALVGRPFAELLRDEVSEAAAQGLAVAVRVDGHVDSCTPSQRIALLRVVHEALTNVLRHSGAESASVVVQASGTQLSASITDDGQGFDVDRVREEAARAGRLGLVGMRERVRLLGGTLELTSREGGPTTVRATIARWRPGNA